MLKIDLFSSFFLSGLGLSPGNHHHGEAAILPILLSPAALEGVVACLAEWAEALVDPVVPTCERARFLWVRFFRVF